VNWLSKYKVDAACKTASNFWTYCTSVIILT